MGQDALRPYLDRCVNFRVFPPERQSQTGTVQEG